MFFNAKHIDRMYNRAECTQDNGEREAEITK